MHQTEKYDKVKCLPKSGKKEQGYIVFEALKEL
jgi:hypothetical protein